jgi:predicted TIM-barrel fold metal-dependent hydrolase
MGTAPRWLISGDSHVMEPLDMWQTALAARWGEAVPRIVASNGAEPGRFFFTGREHIRMGEVVAERTTDRMTMASRDPAVRLSCLDEDGVYAEVISPTWLLFTLRAADADLVRDCCAVYNDWIAEFCSHAPQRLGGTALVHMADVDGAVTELERVARKGTIRCVIINNDAHPGWAPYRDARYDRFWACAAEIGMPVQLHIITGNARDPFTLKRHEFADMPRVFLGLFADAGGPFLNEFIYGGIMDRHPTLKLMFAEYEVSWLTYWLMIAERIERDIAPIFKLTPPRRPVREYLARIHHGLVDELYIDKVLDVVDTRTLIWGSDFPHIRSTYPHSHAVVERIFGHLGQAALDAITVENAARLFKFELPPAASAKAAE